MVELKHNLLKILGALPLVVTITCFNQTIEGISANPTTGISVRTDNKGRVTGLSNLADPDVLRGTSCRRQINARGVISQIEVGGILPSITGIQFEGRYYNISRTLRNTPQIKSFLTSGKPVSITYTPTGASCRFLWIESIQSAETQNQSTISSSEFIGLKDIPSGLKEMGGWVIVDEYFDALKSFYSVAEISSISCKYRPCLPESNQMLWFKKITSHDKSGKAIFQVIDVLNLPGGYEKDFKYQIFKRCSFNQVYDPEIFAIARFDLDKEISTDIRKAWRANRKSGRFEEVNSVNVICSYR